MEFNFCTICAEPLTKNTATRYKCPNNHIIYNNPRPTATVMIVKDGQVLLGRRADEPHKGKTDVIGGFLDYKEYGPDAARREAKEETGLDIELGGIIGIYPSMYEENISVSNISYEATVLGGELKAGDDVAELYWIDIKNLEKEQLAWPWQSAMIKDFVAKHKM